MFSAYFYAGLIILGKENKNINHFLPFTITTFCIVNSKLEIFERLTLFLV